MHRLRRMPSRLVVHGPHHRIKTDRRSTSFFPIFDPCPWEQLIENIGHFVNLVVLRDVLRETHKYNRREGT